jgi:hypothetical protein
MLDQIISVKEDEDIMNIHRKILDIFDTDTEKNILEEIRRLKSLNDVAVSDKKFTKDAIKNLNDKLIFNRENKKLKPLYLKDIGPFLDNYIKSKRPCFFGQKKVIDSEKLEEFLKLTQRYVRIKVFPVIVCDLCNAGVCECKKNVKVSKNEYENEQNFRKGLLRLQGKQIKTYDTEKLIRDLDEYFDKYNLQRSGIIRQMPLNDDGITRGETTISIMNNALGESGIKQTSLYKDIYLICQEYWNWVLPDLKDVQDQIENDYKSTQKVYNSIDKERKSCLNLNFRIFKHLEARDYPIKKELFKLPSTIKIINEHDRLWKRMCIETELNYIPT